MLPLRKSARLRSVSDKAKELIAAGDAQSWNKWRQEYNLFGDHVDARIDLAGSLLPGRDFRGFILTNVDLATTDLQGSNLDGCDCTSGNFYLARLIKANLSGSCLMGANLSRAYLRQASLENANLRGVDLRRASITGASLLGADIRGVDLTATRGVSQAQIEEAIGDATTALPAHIERPSSWIRYAPSKIEQIEPGQVPAALPATVEVRMEAGRLALAADAGDALFTTSFDEEELRRDLIDDLESIVPRLSNAADLFRSASRYLECLKDRATDIIIIGMRGVHFTAQARAMSGNDKGEQGAELLPDVIGALNGIAIQHFLFVGQSHKWRSFFEEAQKSGFSASDLAKARVDGESLSSLLRSQPDACDPEVANSLDRAVLEIKLSSSEAKLLVFNMYASIQNILRVLTSWAVREFRRAGTLAWDTFRDNLARGVGAAGATLVGGAVLWFSGSQLASKWPQYFEWFRFFAKLIEK